ncbi:putative ribonuclease H-like domain-containing protein [Tanacetum coccineum]|uniref:Ribonuclease H-like domain-containing protein n=1 Tax=Tanacetum coccineum TaxID=301880 RepID=A0ABQ5APF3_9ASTR
MAKRIWVEAIRLFFAYASFMNFPVYHMDVKSAFLYGTIKEEIKPQQVSDVVQWAALTFFLGLTSQAEKRMGSSLGQDKSMIRSLMYLTSSRPDIIFSVCACSRFQVQPKVSHLNTVKRIFRYLKGQPKLGLWYPKDSPLILEAFSDTVCGGNSTTEGWNTFAVLHSVCGQDASGSIIKSLMWKRLIEMVKIHTDYNVRDLLTKAFDVTRFQFLIASIVDFLADSHIRYALTANPTIYASLIEQFWQTATVETVNNGEQQLFVKVDGQTIVITEASVRRDLQLADADDKVTSLEDELASTKAVYNKALITSPNRNCTKLGRIGGNLVQLWVQFIPDNGTGVSLLFCEWDSRLKDIHQMASA